MNLNRLSASDRKLIKEAMRLINKGGSEAIFIKSGWKGPYRGAYKKAFIKGKMVAKRGPEPQLKQEVKLWNKTGRLKTYRKFRKHLARVFGTHKNWIFQRFVHGERSCDDSDRCYKIAGRMRIEDSGNHNHRHDSKGRPIWFDTNTY